MQWPFIIICGIGIFLILTAYYRLYHAPDHARRSRAAQLILLGVIIVMGTMAVNRANEISRKTTLREIQSRIDTAEMAAGQARARTADKALRRFNRRTQIFNRLARKMQQNFTKTWTTFNRTGRVTIDGQVYTTQQGMLAAIRRQNDANGNNDTLRQTASIIALNSDVITRNTTGDHAGPATTRIAARRTAYKHLTTILTEPEQASNLHDEQVAFNKYYQLATSYGHS